MRCLSFASLVQTRPIPQGGTATRNEQRGASIGVDGACTLVRYTFGDWSGASAGARDWTAVRLDAEGVLRWKWQVVLHGPDHNTEPPGLTALHVPKTFIRFFRKCQLDKPYFWRKGPTNLRMCAAQAMPTGCTDPARVDNNTYTRLHPNTYHLSS